MRKQVKTALFLAAVILANVLVGVASYQKGYGDGAKDAYNPINLGANDVQFSASELERFEIVKNRVYVNNTDPAFKGTNDTRTLEWISMRNSSSNDYYQKSMEYLCFWTGQGANGEWESLVSIYNSPNSTSDYVVEVSRFTWHSLEVRLDGKIVASFPQVTNDTTSVGYATFHVKV